MEDYDTPNDFEGEINTATRKRKAPEADKTKKPKWNSGEIETQIDELEKRSCLWDVFGKDYHNREKREVAYPELEEIFVENDYSFASYLYIPLSSIANSFMMLLK